MKSVILFICLFFSYFTLAVSVPMEEVVFTDAEIENLPPVDEMIGIPIEAPKLGEADVDNKKKFEEAEIQLAHGGECRRHHGGHGCGRGRDRDEGHYHDHDHDDTVIVIISQPVLVNNVCRKGLAYCLTPASLPLGTYCECNSIYGYYVFSGKISSY